MKTIKTGKLSFFTILTFSLILALGSCSAGKSGVKTGKKLFTDFFVGDAGTQYFIKPLTFENADKLYAPLRYGEIWPKRSRSPHSRGCQRACRLCR